MSAIDENVGKVLRALERSGLAGDTRVLYTSDHGDNVGARGLWGKSTFYEESAGVPLIVAGDGRRRRRRARHAGRATSTSIPFVFECVGAPAPRDDAASRHLARAARRRRSARTAAVLSEYHAIGSVAGAFMLRDGHYKYVHYVAYPPQLFDLARDPGRAGRRRGRPGVRAGARPAAPAAATRSAIRTRSTRARSGARRELLARFGGREAALARGDLGFTPAPGTQPEMS